MKRGGAPQLTFALFRALPGKTAGLEAAAKRHEEVLRRERLVTTRPIRTWSSNDASVVLQLLEWDESPDATVPTKSAHTNAAVQHVWSDFAASAQFLPFGALAQPLLPQVVFVAARAKPGRQESVRQLLLTHARAVREKKLTGEQQVYTFQSDVDGAFLQMIQAPNTNVARQVSADPDLRRIRTQLGNVATLIPVSALRESSCSFLSLALVSEN